MSFLTQRQINKHAFSGGRDSAEEQREFGANLDVDVSWQYLTFVEDDDERLAQIGQVRGSTHLNSLRKLAHFKQDYSSGKKLTGELKKILIEKLVTLVERHQRARARVTEDVVDAFLTVRPLNFN